MAFSWSGKLGIVTLAPWVALLGFDLGVLPGIGGAAGATALWLIASDADQVNLDGTQIVVRTCSLMALAIGSALAGRRLRASEAAHRSIASLQSSLIDATLDGICLTDASGNILISNRQLRKLRRRPRHGAGRNRHGAAALDLGRDRGAGPLPHADARARSRARRSLDRRIRSRSNGSRLPGLHRSGPPVRRRCRRPHLDAPRGHGRPRARPDARCVRRDGLARAADAADVHLRLPRDDAGRGAGARRVRAAIPRRDPPQHRAPARARRRPAADRADRGEPDRARGRADRSDGSRDARSRVGASDGRGTRCRRRCRRRPSAKGARRRTAREPGARQPDLERAQVHAGTAAA